MMQSPLGSIRPAASVAAPPSVVPKRPPRLSIAGFAWAALAVTIFSGWFVVTRLGVTNELRVWDIIALRFGGGALLLLPVLLSRKRRLPSGAWLEGFVFALLWGAPFVFLVALGLQLTSAGQASSITPALMPVFAGLIGWLIFREAPGASRLLGYSVIVAGLTALVTVNAVSNEILSPGGIASLIVAAAMWAMYTLRFRLSGLTPLQAAALICFWSAALYLPGYLLFGLSRLGDATHREVAFQAVYQGVLVSAVAIVAFNRAVDLLGAGAAAAIIALVPVLASAIAIPVLGEIPSGLADVAIGAIAIGVVLAARPMASRQIS